MAKIKRFGVLKMAYFMGLYGIVIGFIAAIFMGFFMVVFSSINPEIMGEVGTQISIFKWWFIILYPIGYGLIGFLSGLIFTPIINLILKIIHGVDLDIKMSAK